MLKIELCIFMGILICLFMFWIMVFGLKGVFFFLIIKFCKMLLVVDGWFWNEGFGVGIWLGFGVVDVEVGWYDFYF